MRKQFVLLVMIALFGAVSVMAEDLLKVTIPFEFSVADSTLPAGEYYLKTNGSNAVVRIRDFNTHLFVYALSGHTKRLAIPEVTTYWIPITAEIREPQSMANTQKLMEVSSPYNSVVFRQYGDTYFLATLWHGFTGRTFTEGKKERQFKAAPMFTEPETLVLLAEWVQ